MLQHQIASYEPSNQQELVRFLHDMLGSLGFELELDGLDADLRDIRSEYQSRGGVFILAKHQEQLIGSVALRQIAKDVGELRRFYVLPEYQGRGVGVSLLKRALDHAKAGPWRCIRLDTTTKSPAAISLFRRQGFVEIARYHDNPRAEFFMELPLG